MGGSRREKKGEITHHCLPPEADSGEELWAEPGVIGGLRKQWKEGNVENKIAEKLIKVLRI